MGVSAVGKDITERSRNAESALETALQRGGDQVAMRTPTGIDFFGGKTKINQKRTKVRSRVNPEAALQALSAASGR